MIAIAIGLVVVIWLGLHPDVAPLRCAKFAYGQRCDRVRWHRLIDDSGHVATFPSGSQVAWHRGEDLADWV